MYRNINIYSLLLTRITAKKIYTSEATSNLISILPALAHFRRMEIELLGRFQNLKMEMYHHIYNLRDHAVAKSVTDVEAEK